MPQDQNIWKPPLNPATAEFVDATAQPVTRKLALLIACWLLFVGLVVLALAVPGIIDAFKEVFVSFGADLPLLTMAFMWARYGWWILPAIALVLALTVSFGDVLAQGTRRRIKLAWVALLVVSLLLLFLMVVAMYLPIFKLGKPSD